jgi:hypothetical protein
MTTNEQSENNIIILTNEDGSKEEAEVIYTIKDLDEEKGDRDFIMFTKNGKAEKEDNGYVQVYFSEVIVKDDSITLTDVDDETFVKCLERIERETDLDLSEVFETSNVKRITEKTNKTFWQRAFDKLNEHSE